MTSPVLWRMILADHTTSGPMWELTPPGWQEASKRSTWALRVASEGRPACLVSQPVGVVYPRLMVISQRKVGVIERPMLLLQPSSAKIKKRKGLHPGVLIPEKQALSPGGQLAGHPPA